MKNVKTLIITGYGINADKELASAFNRAGSEASSIHVNDLIRQPAQLREYGILAFPGGFSFGDHLGSGRILSHIIKAHMEHEFAEYLRSGRLVIGICNGFQTITKMGLVPNLAGTMQPEVSLVHNDCGSFIDRWVELKTNPRNPSPWLKGLSGMKVPIRHGEGRLVCADSKVDQDMLDHECAAFWYLGTNPNGSFRSLAGITDATGRVLGMMPHPEACIYHDQMPGNEGNCQDEPTAGMRLFMNAIEFCKNEL